MKLVYIAIIASLVLLILNPIVWLAITIEMALILVAVYAWGRLFG